MRLSTLTPIEEMLIDRFVRRITEKIEVDSIYLFGSRARGEGDIESDIDVAVVIEDRKRIKEISKRAMDR